MGWMQLFTWGAILLLVGIVGYIIFSYVVNLCTTSYITSSLVGDGTSTATIELSEEAKPLQDDNFESGYVSD